MPVNKTDVSSEWEIIKHPKKQKKTISYNSDGFRFKEDIEREYTDRTYLKQAHADDDNIQNHTETGMNGIVYETYWPWSQSINGIDEEIIKGWEIEFNPDGRAVARISTRELTQDWETTTRYKPVRLNKKPESND